MMLAGGCWGGGGIESLSAALGQVSSDDRADEEMPEILPLQ